jgi:hypothetical protein
VTEPTGDRPHIDTCVDQLRRRVVAQRVDVALDAEPGGEPAVPLGDGVGPVAAAVVRLGGEYLIGRVVVRVELCQAVEVPAV